MNIQTIRKVARQKLTGICKVCDICDGQACAGQVPGIGGIGTGTSFKANIDSLARYKFRRQKTEDRYQVSDQESGIRNQKLEVKSQKNSNNQQATYNHQTVTNIRLFGKKLSSPILVAPMCGTDENLGNICTEEEFAYCLVKGAHNAGTIAFTGDGDVPIKFEAGLKTAKATKTFIIPIIKPREQTRIIKQIKTAENSNAIAVGIDIDSVNLFTMTSKNQPVEKKSKAQLLELVNCTHLPFIIKGISTIEQAIVAIEVGAAGIVISNHGGRIKDYMPGIGDLLTQIADKIKGKTTIFVDGGIRSGSDIFKCLALSADFVLIGRPMIIGAIGGGWEGVTCLLSHYKNGLIKAMKFNNCKYLNEINRNTLVCRTFTA